MGARWAAPLIVKVIAAFKVGYLELLYSYNSFMRFAYYLFVLKFILFVPFFNVLISVLVVLTSSAFKIRVCFPWPKLCFKTVVAKLILQECNSYTLR